jgi:predicted transcriptional regulator
MREMSKKTRRNKMKIYGDLLFILKAEKSNTDSLVLTHIQTKMNVPFDRLKTYISDLKDLDLIVDQHSCNITEKGKQYLDEYKKILDFMDRMGIANR